MRIMLPFVVVGIAVGFTAAQEKPPANWDGPLCKPVDREAVYEFATAPAVKKIGPDRYEITFTAKGKCDVAVAVEGRDGRIVRHIVYGVLGPNAPAPLKKDTLQQTLNWDGKDEFGKYLANPEQCRVRVSLGLNPTFDKIIGGHSHDTSSGRKIGAITADADGAYVLECVYGGNHQLRKYDHDGNYLKTLYPWDPDQLDRIAIPKRTLPDGKVWQDAAPPAGSRQVPVTVMGSHASTMPFHAVGDGYTVASGMATAAGKLGLYTKGGMHDIRRLLRLQTDGTTGGEPIEGARFTDKLPTYSGQAHIAMSPDGKWVYITGLSRKTPTWRDGLALPSYSEPPPYAWNAVFRFAWDAQGVVVEGKDSFIGEVSRDAKKAGADTDNDHLNGPQGLACDTAGRLYVADFGNNRIQVFSPGGKYLKTIPVKEPQEIAVHAKTGEIYVLCFRRGEHGIPERGQLTLVKFGPLAEATERFKQTFPAEGEVYIGSVRVTPVMALDAWAPEPRVWLVHKQGVVRIYADKGKELQLVRDFEEDVRKAGHTPHAMHNGYMGYITADPVRGHVYRGIGNLTRVDPEEGKTWEGIDLRTFYELGGAQETVFGWDGLMYVRPLRSLARFNPDKFKNPIVLDADCEVPFDYGETKAPTERRGGEAAAKLNGVLSFPWAMGGANGYNNGIGISARGDVLVLIENFQDAAAFKAMKFKDSYIDASLLNPFLQQMEDRFRPAQFPGRTWAHGNLVWRYNRQGQVVALDALPGLPAHSFGIRTDADGNFYVGIGYHRNVDGKSHIGGSLAKFAPKGGRLLHDSQAQVKLATKPERPPEFIHDGRIWAQNMFWAAPGLDQLNFGGCECLHCKFDTDLYGRSFMPRAYGYHVAVLDTSGNRICEIGRHGNADHPAMKPGDTDIGLGPCSYLATVSDQWLYIADDANLRIIRVKLGYRTEQRVIIGGQ
ncbi:hypothetical protein AYO44_01070 [Planctomycetaceae bacterium SCGC AG-212-F19]|nr:hypothetical protein AYO44_01070 [Planctomycetaceae bacterium SCGC AG-212-F19]